MKQDFTRELEDIKRIIRKYYEQLYAHKSHNLEKMDQFSLEVQTITTHPLWNNLNALIKFKKIEC